MIKPVTFQGQSNFNANLYALEVKSRFIDQKHADGYYEGYGNELAAQIVGQTIQVGTGAYLVQGRMSEITAPETVRPQIFDGFKGYVVARIETYHPADEFNPSIIAKVNTTFDALDRELEQNDTYAANADNNNVAYELPIYSFEISGTQIVNLQKLIKPIRDYATVKALADEAAKQAKAAADSAAGAATDASNANTAAGTAQRQAEAANGEANTARQQAEEAARKATEANEHAGNAEQAAARAAQSASDAASEVEKIGQQTSEAVTEFENKVNEKVAELEQQIGEKQGTTVTVKGAAQPTFEAGGLIDEADEIYITCGGA